MKSNNKRGFVLLETLLAIALFALAAATLSYSFVNGLICQKQSTKHTNNFEELIFEVANRCSSASELRNIKSILLPTGDELNTTFEIESTTTEALYKVTTRLDNGKYRFRIANRCWDTD